MTVPLPVMRWNWDGNLSRYDRSAALMPDERDQLARFAERIANGRKGWPPGLKSGLTRILEPLYQALDHLGVDATDKRNRTVRSTAVSLLLRAMHKWQISFWGFTAEQWHAIIGADYYAYIRHHGVTANARHQILGIAYLLYGFDDWWNVGRLSVHLLAEKIFGQQRMEANLNAVLEPLHTWGFSKTGETTAVACALAGIFLKQRTCTLQDIKRDTLLELYRHAAAAKTRRGLILLSYVLTRYAVIDRPLGRDGHIPSDKSIRHTAAAEGVHPAWLDFAERWFATSTLQRTTRVSVLYRILQAARWDSAVNAADCGPSSWTRQRCVEFVAAVDRWKVGDFSRVTGLNSGKTGQPFSAATKEGLLRGTRSFFCDAQEWEWLPRHFDPVRTLRTPKSIRSLIGPDPRVVDDNIWAKLMWAGLNLTDDDIKKRGIPHMSRSGSYPLKMIQAVAVVWLFTGLRRNEVMRLRLGCVRWDRSAAEQDGPANATCFLDVPVNKTNVAFSKPVDSVVGHYIDEWERVRPPQPALIDPKTGESVHLLFSYRNRSLGDTYLNASLIPLLCHKAGVPADDARGAITSHRARATIASQLYNAKEPLDLFQLQQWLGHRSPESTRHYTRISPTRLAKSYTDAGYFARNLRAIDVLIDRDVVEQGSAADEPWKFYDLGHGYCSYDFFEQCPHRMACARCDFYIPKESSQAQILEGKANLLRLTQEIMLNDEERAAIDEGVQAYDRLLDRLAKVSVPSKSKTEESAGAAGWKTIRRVKPP